jgi:hypothetical protein
LEALADTIMSDTAKPSSPDEEGRLLEVPPVPQQQEEEIVDTAHSSVNLCQKHQQHLIHCLPNQVLSYIFSFLTQTMIITTVFPVSKRWYQISKFQSPALWRHIDFDKILNEIGTPVTTKVSMQDVNAFFQGLTTNSLTTDLDKLIVKAKFGGQLVFPRLCTNMTAKNFQQLRKFYPTVKSMMLPSLDMISNGPSNSIQSISDACMKQISYFGQLEHLKLATHHKITDVGIQTLIGNCSNLVSLDLDYCLGTSAASFSYIMNHCSKLRFLSMLGNGNTMVERKDLEQLSSAYVLQELRLDIGPDVDYACLANLVSKCRKIKNLYLRGCAGFDGKCFELLTTKLYQLESLTLICADGVKLFSPRFNSATLKTVHLSRPEAFANALITCPQLQHFYIDQCQDLQKLEFKGCSNVSELRLRSCNLSRVNMDSLFGLKGQLKELELFDCRMDGCSKVCLSSSALQKVVLFMCNDMTELRLDCENLHTLSVDVCVELEKMHLKCPVLETLQLFVLPQIQQPKLQYLGLESTKITSLNLQRTSLLSTINLKCEQLDSLNMAGCRDLRTFARLICPKLDKLAMGSSTLDYTPECIKQLTEGCPSISMLSISNAPQLNDACLHLLCKNLKSLQALVLSNCSNLQAPALVANNLKGVQLTDCATVHEISIQSSNLAKLFIRNCPNITDAAIENISNTCPNVKFLEVFNCSGIKTPQITCLELTDLHFTRCDNLEYPVLKCPSLKKLLLLSNPRVRDIQFSHQCQSTAELLFSDCPMVTDALVSRLQHYAKNLQAMVFAKCAGIKRPFINFDHLKILRFSECHHLIHPIVSSPSGSLQLSVVSFQDCPSLEISSISNTCHKGVVDQVEISQCDHIFSLSLDMEVHHINVSRCENLQEVTLSHPNIEKVKIEECPALTLVACHGCTHLSEMSVRRCHELSDIEVKTQQTKKKIFNSVLLQEESMDSLKKLELSQCPRISDLCVTKLLRKCQALEQIEINECE